ncbi:MAG: hypothetical protein IPM29_10160 [Planctomycetes bacterium]|nr:hypothetical protein [Planctomycetota bacterium]
MRTIGLEPSFGFGDRTGLATAGHVAAWHAAGSGLVPVFAQQSIREMDRTGRSPDDVLRDAERGLRAAGERPEVSGADADHLKTAADIAVTVAAGFRTFTLDPSDHVPADIERTDAAGLRARLRAHGESERWFEQFRGREVRLDNGTVLRFDDGACARALARLGRAIRHVIDLGAALAAAHDRLGDPRRAFEIEVSVDETATPTTLVEHWIVASLCLEHGLPLIAIAPRLPGAFEKAVDHRGDRATLERAVHDHAAVARALGGHKLSLHSGSDKLSVYGLLATATRGHFHVKTAGTSWLEALRVVARRDPQLFVRIVRFARERYAEARRSYELSADLADVPPPDEVDDARTLEAIYLGDWARVPPGRGFTTPGRQLVHCTYGHVWCDATLGPAVRALLEAEQSLHHELLAEHFTRHLAPLTAALR